MKVSKFTHGNPDSDGEINFELEAMIENESDHDIEFVYYSWLIVNENETSVLGGNYEDDSVFIGAKDSGSISLISWDRVHKDAFASGNASESTAHAAVTTYRREFVKVGTIDVPSKPGEMTSIDKKISLGGAAELMGISCLRNKDDDDGNMDLVFAAGVKNTSDDYISRVQITMKAMDQRDAQIEEDVRAETLPPKAITTIQPYMWGLAPGKMKNGQFVVTASVFLPIESYTAEATPVLSND